MFLYTLLNAEDIWVLIRSSRVFYSSIYREPAGVSQDEEKQLPNNTLTFSK